GRPPAAAKRVLAVEVGTGQFTAAEVLPGRDNEKTAATAARPLPPGALLLEDMGFLSGARLRGHIDRGVYVLTRVPAWTAFFEPAGGRRRRLDLLKRLRRARGGRWERRGCGLPPPHRGRRPARGAAPPARGPPPPPPPAPRA